jgi:hypothetical protein
MDYSPKYIKLEPILKMMVEELNLEIEEKAHELVAKFFDKAVEKAAAELSNKFK